MTTKQFGLNFDLLVITHWRQWKEVHPQVLGMGRDMMRELLDAIPEFVPDTEIPLTELREEIAKHMQ